MPEQTFTRRSDSDFREQFSMTSYLPAARLPYTPVPLWTGRTEFDLKTDRGQWAGTVEVVVRIDDVSLWFGNRTLAVLDREAFREWLVHPDRPFRIDDVVWTTQGMTTFLAIDGGTPYAVPAGVMADLVAVV